MTPAEHVPVDGAPLRGRRFAVEHFADRCVGVSRSWAFVGVVVAGFVAAQAWLLATGQDIHDEGILTYLYSSYMLRDPVASLFFPKFKPVLALLNAPAALLGPRAFVLGHIAIGVVGIIATAAAARAANLKNWALAAMIVAASPMYVQGTVRGLSNVDGVAFAAVVIWLALRERRPGFWVGTLVALLPAVRFEAAMVSVVVALALLWRDRSPRFAVGLLLLPGLYMLAGAVWHRDALWLLHHPVAPSGTSAGFYQTVTREVRSTGADALLFAATTVTPVMGLVWLRVRNATPVVRLGQICTALFLAGIFGLPRLGVAMGYSQRYALVILPVVAIAVAWQLESARTRRELLGALVVGLLAGGLALRGGPRGEAAMIVLAAVAGSTLFAAVATAGLPALASVGLATFVAAWSLTPQPLDVFQASRHAPVRSAMDWLRRHPETTRHASAIVTNLKLLDSYVRRADPLRHLEVFCLLQRDNEVELLHWANEANGQRARLLELARWRFYGRGVLAREFAARPGPPGALVVLGRDSRLQEVNVAMLVARGARIVHEEGDVTILQLAREPRAGPMP